MKRNKVFSILIGAAFLLALPAVATTTPQGTKILNVLVQVTANGKTIGTFPVRPAHPIPTRAGATYTLTLLGTTISGGKVETVPLDGTFSIHSGEGRVELSDPGSGSVDVKVLHRGRHGNQIKYVITSDDDIRRGLTQGYINLF